MSTTALHSPFNISETEAWFQRTTNRKWPTWNRVITWPITSRGCLECYAFTSIKLVSCNLLLYVLYTCQKHKILLNHSFVTSKDVKWCRLILGHRVHLPSSLLVRVDLGYSMLCRVHMPGLCSAPAG